MEEQHSRQAYDDVITFVPKEGQRGLLCCNKKSFRCPSLDYKHVVSLENNLNRAFDILFEEVMKFA